MFQFGIGALYGRPSGGNLATPSGPVKFGTIQDVMVEFNQKLVPLRGQNKFPDDVAPSDMDVKGKSGFGRIEIAIYNSLFFADAITAGIKKMEVGESHPVPAMMPFTVTVTNSANYLEDLGVFSPTTGLQLQEVTAGTEVAGKSYSVVQTGGGKGVYTFAAGDTGVTYLFDYAWTNAAAGNTLTVLNHIQGYGPIFELWLGQFYQDPGNGLHLFQCRASKMSAPQKRDNYLISDFEFEAYPNSANQMFEWFQVSV